MARKRGVQPSFSRRGFTSAPALGMKMMVTVMKVMMVMVMTTTLEELRSPQCCGRWRGCNAALSVACNQPPGNLHNNHDDDVDDEQIAHLKPSSSCNKSSNGIN